VGVQIMLYDDLTGTALRGDAEGDKLFSIEGAMGSAHGDTFRGNSLRNVVRGEGGADHLSGWAAATSSAVVTATTPSSG
jgi:hypothetical protein